MDTITKKEEKKQHRKLIFKRIKENKQVYLMMLPVVAFFLIFAYFPMYGIIIAFKDYRPSLGILRSPFSKPFYIHFKSVFDTPYFFRAMKNTLIISLIKIIFCFPAPIILALMMNELKSKTYKKVVQTIVYLPNFISWVIFGGLVYDIFGFDGVINSIRSLMGLNAKGYMSDGRYYYLILIVFSIIKDAGWGSIIYMAAMSAVNPSLYEAAEIDGCGRIKKIIHVTLPCIVPIIMIQLLLSIGNIMNAGFDAIFNTYNKNLYDVADILDTYIYRVGLEQGSFSMATAIGLFKSVINFALLLSANFIVKKVNGTGIYDVEQ